MQEILQLLYSRLNQTVPECYFHPLCYTTLIFFKDSIRISDQTTNDAAVIYT